jgi:hypothetical protein
MPKPSGPKSELGTERRRRALKREGKYRGRGGPAKTEGEPGRDQAQRRNQTNEQDGQHWGPDAGMGAIGQSRPGLPAGAVPEEMRVTIRRVSSGVRMTGQELQDGVGVSRRALDAGLSTGYGGHRNRRDRHPNPCASVPGQCHRLSRAGETATHLTLCHRNGFA